eukprot:545065-Alexandrium_andersonii.AAC.1
MAPICIGAETPMEWVFLRVGSVFLRNDEKVGKQKVQKSFREGRAEGVSEALHASPSRKGA